MTNPTRLGGHRLPVAKPSPRAMTGTPTGAIGTRPWEAREAAPRHIRSAQTFSSRRQSVSLFPARLPVDPELTTFPLVHSGSRAADDVGCGL